MTAKSFGIHESHVGTVPRPAIHSASSAAKLYSRPRVIEFSHAHAAVSMRGVGKEQTAQSLIHELFWY